MKMKFVMLVLTMCFWIGFGSVQAVPITIEIEGTITSVYGSGLPNEIHSGVSFTGSYTYDSLSLDMNTDPKYGEYIYNSPFGISLDIGGYEFKTVSSHVNKFNIRIINDATANGTWDYYSVASHVNDVMPSAGLTVSYINWILGDSAHTVLSSDALPVLAPVLTEWNYNDLSISGSNSLDQGYYIQGIVTQVTPEPLTITFLATAGTLILRRRR